MSKFSLEVAYAQLAVFDSAMTHPFNDWTDKHVAQGFAWRPGSVSFGTLETAGTVNVEVFRAKPFDEAASVADRIIVVPFTGPRHGLVEIASIGDAATFELPSGEYELAFEHGRGPAGDMWARLFFRSVTVPVLARIARADADLAPPAVLLMTAQPA